MWFWILVGVLVALLVLGAWLWDRRWTLNQEKADESHHPDRTTPYDLGDGGFTL